MPKTVHVPAYKLHKPSGQARVILHGRQVYLGPYGSPESQERYARLIAEHASNPAGVVPDTASVKADGKLLIVQLCAAYLEHARNYYCRDNRPTGSMPRVIACLKVLRALYAHTPADEFGPLKLQAVQRHLVDQGKSRRYVNHLVQANRRVFRWGASQELIPIGAYHGLGTVQGITKGRTSAREPEPVKPVPESVVQATLPYLSAVVSDMVRFQRLTGCRPAEVCVLRPADVDRGGDVWGYRPSAFKTDYREGAERMILIGPKGQAILRPYLLRAPEAFCFSPADSERTRREELHERRVTPLSCGNRPNTNRKRNPKKQPGDCYDSRSYYAAIRRAVAKANRQRVKDAAEQGIKPDLLPHWHPNQLRHSKATEVRKLFGLEAAQVTLGHAHARITEVYAERDTKLAADIARKIG